MVARAVVVVAGALVAAVTSPRVTIDADSGVTAAVVACAVVVVAGALVAAVVSPPHRPSST